MSRAGELPRLRAEAAELRRRLAQAEARAEAAERLAQERARAVVLTAHELRAPLTAILGYAALLAEDGEAEAAGPRAEALQIVLRNARHLVRVAADLLNLSKADAGSLEVTLAPVDVGAVAGAALASLRPAAEERRIRLRLHDGARVRARADAGRLRQVLVNLLDNALKYSPPGAAVHVRVRGSGAAVLLAVRDEGPGIDAVDHRRLFRDFSRVQQPGARVAGAGLGLALVRRLVQAMGGTVGVRSQPGRGSTFWVRLPSAGRGGAPGEPARPGAARILVVDDDADVRRFAVEVLRRAGFVALEHDGAPGGPAGGEAELVLLDLNLPGDAAAPVAAALRARRPRPRLVAFSGLPRERLEAAARALGCDGWLQKPVEPEALVRCVAEVLGRRDPRVPAALEAPLAELHARFLAGLPRRLAELEAARASGDRGEVVHHVHRLRGAAAGFGVAGLAHAAATAEEALHAGAGVDAPELRTLAAALRGAAGAGA